MQRCRFTSGIKVLKRCRGCAEIVQRRCRWGAEVLRSEVQRGGSEEVQRCRDAEMQRFR